MERRACFTCDDSFHLLELSYNMLRNKTTKLFNCNMSRSRSRGWVGKKRWGVYSAHLLTSPSHNRPQSLGVVRRRL